MKQTNDTRVEYRLFKEQLEALESQRRPGESKHQAAKRLMLGSLELEREVIAHAKDTVTVYGSTETR